MKYLSQFLRITAFTLAGELFQRVIPLPVPAKIFDSYDCEGCGEKTGANWIRLVNGKKLCPDCCQRYNRFDV